MLSLAKPQFFVELISKNTSLYDMPCAVAHYTAHSTHITA